MEYFEGFEEKSFKLGMINAFCEIVAQDVKPLALSPILEKEQWEIIKPASETIVAEFGVKSYTETSFMPSDFAPDQVLEGKIVILYYKYRETLQSYLNLKEDCQKLVSAGLYDETQRKNTSISLRRLLGYSESAIAKHYA